jgi:hypothetical protein
MEWIRRPERIVELTVFGNALRWMTVHARGETHASGETDFHGGDFPVLSGFEETQQEIVDGREPPTVSAVRDETVPANARGVVAGVA